MRWQRGPLLCTRTITKCRASQEQKPKSYAPLEWTFLNHAVRLLATAKHFITRATTTAHRDLQPHLTSRPLLSR